MRQIPLYQIHINCLHLQESPSLYSDTRHPKDCRHLELIQQKDLARKKWVWLFKRPGDVEAWPQYSRGGVAGSAFLVEDVGLRPMSGDLPYSSTARCGSASAKSSMSSIYISKTSLPPLIEEREEQVEVTGTATKPTKSVRKLI